MAERDCFVPAPALYRDGAVYIRGNWPRLGACSETWKFLGSEHLETMNELASSLAARGQAAT